MKVVLTLKDEFARSRVLSFAEILSEPWSVEASNPPSAVANIDLLVSPMDVDVGGTVSFQGTVVDQYGVPMRGIHVDVVITDSSGIEVGRRAAITNPTGGYATSYTFGTTGTFNAVAMAEAVESQQFTIVVTQPAAVPSALTLNISPTSVEVGDPVSFTGSLTDQYGNPVPDAPVYVDIKDASGTILTTLETQTDPIDSELAGAYSLQYAFTSAGTYTVQARAPTSFAYGITFPNSEGRTIKVYESGVSPTLPEWVLPAIGIGAVAIIGVAIGYWRWQTSR